MCPSTALITSSSLICSASPSRFCVFWMTKTMRNVTIVVAVLMTSCQVELNAKTGPARNQHEDEHHGARERQRVTSEAGGPSCESVECRAAARHADRFTPSRAHDNAVSELENAVGNELVG